MSKQTNNLFENKKLYIIDGYGLIYRAYFAFFSRPLRDSNGENISAVFGFFNTLHHIIKQYQPSYLVVAMDSKGKTFRHDLYPPYKANRDKTPEELHAQIPRINEILDAAGIMHLNKVGYEADDIIAYLTRKAKKENIDSVIVTGDKDLLQLVGDGVEALRPPKKGQKEYNLCGNAEVEELFGVKSSQILDYLTILGDVSDNIPGIKGIGEKGAVKLLNQYGSLDNIYLHIDEMSKGLKKKLEDAVETIPLSKKLIQLKYDLDEEIPFSIESSDVGAWHWDQAIPLLEKTGSTTLVSAAEKAGNIIHKTNTERKNSSERGEYKAITDASTFEKILKQEAEKGFLTIDLETDSLNEMEAEITGISFTSTLEKAWYVPLTAGGKKYMDKQTVLSILQNCLKGINLIGQNIKYDLEILRRCGMTEGNIYFDTMIAAWLLDSSDRRFSMDFLAEKYLNYKTIHFTDVVEKGKTFDSVPLEKAVSYAAEDSDITFRLYNLFNDSLKNRGLFKLFSTLEMPLVSVLMDMEMKGIILDKTKLLNYGKELETDLKTNEKEIYRLCGKEFNINSTKQLQEILFTERELKLGKKTKTGYSTDSSVLENLVYQSDDPVPALILENRKMAKLKSTYVDSLVNMINPHTGRIHTSFLQVGTITGRLSSASPNLQNIPVRFKAGRKIRSCFVPSPGSVFISADYSQIELVVLAHFSQDPSLMKAFINGSDVHQETAALIFDIFPEMVTPEQRRIAKTINFGVMYGMSAFRLAQSLKISRKEASGFIKAYFEKYSGVRTFFDKVIAKAVEEEKVTTLLGHERAVPAINSHNKLEVSGAQRITINTKIQGTAAEIMKCAMINVHKALEEKKLQSRILLQVHDELILEVPEDEIETVKELLRKEMAGAMKLSVPLRASIETGNDWGEMH